MAGHLQPFEEVRFLGDAHLSAPLVAARHARAFWGGHEVTAHAALAAPLPTAAALPSTAAAAAAQTAALRPAQLSALCRQPLVLAVVHARGVAVPGRPAAQ